MPTSGNRAPGQHIRVKEKAKHRKVDGNSQTDISIFANITLFCLFFGEIINLYLPYISHKVEVDNDKPLHFSDSNATLSVTHLKMTATSRQGHFYL
jgi:hypothetical protein